MGRKNNKKYLVTACLIRETQPWQWSVDAIAFSGFMTTVSLDS